MMHGFSQIYVSTISNRVLSLIEFFVMSLVVVMELYERTSASGGPSTHIWAISFMSCNLRYLSVVLSS